MITKTLLVVLAALTVLLGVHMMFALVLCTALGAGFLVVHAGTVTGWRTVPRGARR